MNRLQARSRALLLTVLLLSGCAVNSGDDKTIIAQSIRPVTEQALSQPITQAEQAAVKDRVRQLLQQPLTLQQAIEIAILNNPSIQAELWSLGIAQADLQQLSLMPNPGIKLTRSTGGDGSTELEFGLNLLALITLPTVRDIALQDYQMARIATAQRISKLIHETKLAYWQAIAAQEVLAYVEKVQQATEATAELAKRMATTGNFNKLQFLREQRFLSDSTLNLGLARQTQVTSRQKLKQLLGLWQLHPELTLPERLPELPQQLTPIAEVAQAGLNNRLDVQLASRQLSRLAATLQLTQRSRLVNVFEAEMATELGNSDERSYSLIFELPIFDSGQHRVSRQQAQYQQAFMQATAVGIRARSELQQSWYNYQAQYDIALHYQQTVLPLTQQIADENQLLYNGMFISVFDLLADARSQVSAVTNTIFSKRDYWMAKAELELAQIGTPDGDFSTSLFMQAAPQATEAKGGH